MVTICMSYWERFDVATETVRLWRALEGDSVEIIVVDDGSPTQPFHSDDCLVITIPTKQVPQTPTTPLNEAVKRASGSVVLLTGTDIRPRRKMVMEMKSVVCAKEKAYAQAAVLGPALLSKDARKYVTPRWHSHSTCHCEFFPPGFNPNFCAAMRKQDFLGVGGFDDAFRDGQAFDDTDFAWRLMKRGFKPIQMDHLVCDHIKSGAKTDWPEGAWQRNREIFRTRYPKAPR